VERVDHLLSRYGDMISELVELVGANPTLGEPLAGASDYLRVEIAYAASHEAALHLEDVLTRRTRISVDQPDRGVAVAQQVAEIMGAVLGWDASTVEREVSHYRKRVEAEIAASQEPDEAIAQQIRLAAGDILDRYGNNSKNAEGAKASSSPAAPGVAPPAVASGSN